MTIKDVKFDADEETQLGDPTGLRSFDYAPPIIPSSVLVKTPLLHLSSSLILAQITKSSITSAAHACQSVQSLPHTLKSEGALKDMQTTKPTRMLHQAQSLPLEESCLIVEEDCLQYNVSKASITHRVHTQILGLEMRCTSSMTSEGIRSDANGGVEGEHIIAMTSSDYAVPIFSDGYVLIGNVRQIIRDNDLADAPKVLVSHAVQTRISVEILTRMFEEAHSHPQITEDFVQINLKRQSSLIQVLSSDVERKYNIRVKGSRVDALSAPQTLETYGGSPLLQKNWQFISMTPSEEVKRVSDHGSLNQLKRYRVTSSASVNTHPPSLHISIPLSTTQKSKSSVTTAAQTSKEVKPLKQLALQKQQTPAPLQVEPIFVGKSCQIGTKDSFQCFVSNAPTTLSTCTQTVGSNLVCISTMTYKCVRCANDGGLQCKMLRAICFPSCGPLTNSTRLAFTDRVYQTTHDNRIQVGIPKMLNSCSVQTRISVEPLTRALENARLHHPGSEGSTKADQKLYVTPIQFASPDEVAQNLPIVSKTSGQSNSQLAPGEGKYYSDIWAELSKSDSLEVSTSHTTGKNLRCIAVMTFKEVKCMADDDISDRLDNQIDLGRYEASMQPKRPILISPSSILVKPPLLLNSSSLTATQFPKSITANTAQMCNTFKNMARSLAPEGTDEETSVEQQTMVVKEDILQCFVHRILNNFSTYTQTMYPAMKHNSSITCTEIICTNAVSRLENGIRPARIDTMRQTDYDYLFHVDSPKPYASCAIQTRISVEISKGLFKDGKSYHRVSNIPSLVPLKRQSTSGAIDQTVRFAAGVSQDRLHRLTQFLYSDKRSVSTMTVLEVKRAYIGKAEMSFIPLLNFASDMELVSGLHVRLAQTSGTLLSRATQLLTIMEPLPLLPTEQQTATDGYRPRNMEEICTASRLSLVSKPSSSLASLLDGSNITRGPSISHANSSTQTIKCLSEVSLLHDFAPTSGTKTISHSPWSTTKYSLIQTTKIKTRRVKAVQTSHSVKSPFHSSVKRFESNDYAALMRPHLPLIRTDEESNLIDDQVVELLHGSLTSSPPKQKIIQQDDEVQVDICITAWLKDYVQRIGHESSECVTTLKAKQFQCPLFQRKYDFDGFKQFYNHSCQTTFYLSNLKKTDNRKERHVYKTNKIYKTSQVQVISTYHMEERENRSQECVKVEKELIQIGNDSQQLSDSGFSWIMEKPFRIPDRRVLHVFRLRVRILEYELCDDFKCLLSPRWQKIIEVANQKTGIFTPMAIALHRKWVRMSNQQPYYVDSIRGKNLPFEEAFSLGYVRLASLPNLLDSRSPLIFIERESFGWHLVRGYAYARRVDGTKMDFSEAWRTGYIRATDNGTRVTVWDDHLSMWIPAEEAVAKNVLLVSMNREFKVCKVRRKLFRVSAIQPGGMQSQWLNPLEALTYGVFAWQEGNVADMWLAQPQITRPTLSEAIFVPPTQEFMPLSWKCFYDAWKEGWIQLTQEPNADMVSVTDFDNRRVVKAFMNLVVDPFEYSNRSLPEHLSLERPQSETLLPTTVRKAEWKGAIYSLSAW
ncbi:unnamed protein product [Hydatigera taeniaeformis]|uniref:Protein kinase domain-containing protein n=1 Tax=Hydatigena taeniaeformis TaxID=6205 RepID=A0A0R3X7T7_HYDTA|nr:unnamed protein product [Hydatigera taeniaeformis]